jgi:uncharacterized surface protein with fasciclin (FAS1) repeats
LLASSLPDHHTGAAVTENLRRPGHPPLQGGSIAIRVTGGKVYVGGAQVITPDVMASNGVIHVINKVLIPSDL